MDDQTAARVSEALASAGYPAGDVAYAVGRLRTLLGIKAVERIAGRKLTDKERQRAHVALEAGKSPDEALTPQK